MKIFNRLLLGFIFFFFLLFAGIQTPFVKNWIKHELIVFAKEHNLAISLNKISGILPFEWTFHDVEFSYLNESIYCQKIKLRFSLKELLHKKISITYLKILGNKPWPFEAIGKACFCSFGLTISSCDIISQNFLGRFEGIFSKDFQLKSGHVNMIIPEVKTFLDSPFTGSVSTNIDLNENTAHIQCFLDQFMFKEIPFEQTTVDIHAVKNDSLWHASASIIGGHACIPITGEAECHYSPISHLITLEKCLLSSPECNISTNLEFYLPSKLLEGYVHAQCTDLEKLHPLFPNTQIKGKCEAKCSLHSNGKQQSLHLQVQAEELSIDESKIKQLTIKAAIEDIFHDIHGECSINAIDSTHNDIKLSQMVFHSSFTPHKSPFSLKANGNAKHPLEISMKGNWQKRDRGMFFDIHDCSGFISKKPFSLRDPFSIEWNLAQFQISQFVFDIANGYLSSRMDFTNESSLIKIKAKSFPLDFLQFFRKDISIRGVSSIDIDLVSWKNNIQGNCLCTIEQAELHLEDGEKHPIKGSMQIHLSNNRAQVHADIRAKHRQFLHLSGNFPLNYQHFPFKITLDKNTPFSSNLIAEGKLEDIFEFVNIGSQRIKGWLSMQLLFSKTLCDPCIQGSLEIQNGKYENYMTGTYLKNIYATAKAQKQKIHIQSLKATDDAKGVVRATGIVSLLPQEHFPFEIDAYLKECDTVSFDTITGKFSGNVVISGNLLGAIAKGTLKVEEVHFHIPDKLPTTLPDLPIKFIHFPEHLAHFASFSHPSSPLRLDLEIDAPHKVYIEGKGLQAQLEGNLHITGTYTDILASGTLRLLNGEYLFSGKVFNLTEGELICNARPTPNAYISLKGICDLPEVSVTALLRGPLSAPQLSFQSSPRLSISALLAQILFNKDISEISAIQALQLAQTVFSLSNNAAPDVFEKIRKTLGIDRLTLITSENDPGKISLQIGKYLMQGVLLTLSQGAESRNVAVEVELKQGIMLQAEMNENRQGKFSLKWHHHY